MSRRYLVTGGAGFIGSHFVRAVLEHEPGATVTNLDALTYAGVRATITTLDRLPGHTFVHGDIRDSELLQWLVPGHDVVLNFAAETHVDRSITDPGPFLSTNVVGAGALMETARRAGVERFIHVSTDEVYGPVEDGFAGEDRRLAPSSPYSASKAAADLLAGAYRTTYGYPIIVTRCTNNFGPFQFPEKMIPLSITNLLEGRKVPLYGDGLHERDWLFVGDHCAALQTIVDKGEAGTTYNIGSGAPLANRDLARMLVEILGGDEGDIEEVADRPGHDRRYAVDTDRIRALGWVPGAGLAERLSATVEWYRAHADWWRPLVSSR